MTQRFQFDGFVLDPASGVLLRDGELVRLQPLMHKLLTYLVRRPHALVSRDALTQHLWPDVVVTSASLHQVVRRLRRVLGEPNPLVTVPRRGYRFVSEVEVVPGSTSAGAPPPAVPDRTYGRDALVDEVLHQLEGGDRLVTLTGPGGVGKSRVALLLAHRLGSEDHPLWFVDGSGVTEVAALIRRVATALDLRLSTDAPAHEVAQALGREGAAVLMLDDVDAVSDEMAGPLSKWMGAAPELAIVCTSRVLLGLRGERLVGVEPLPEAVGAALYADRAARTSDPDTVSLVNALEGLPLALELAASRTRVLPPAALLARIEAHLDAVRASRPGDRPPRHQSLRAVFQASWEMLGPQARAALGQLCAFCGPLRLKAAEAVLDVQGSAFDAVYTLVDHSMVHSLGDGRMRLLTTIRRYAEETLSESELRAARLRLAKHLASRCSDEALAEAAADGASAAAQMLTECHDDLVAATRLAVEVCDGELAGRAALGAAFVLHWIGPVSLQLAVMGDALPIATGTSRLQVLEKLAFALFRAGHTEDAMDRYRSLLTAAEAGGHPLHAARGHVGLSNCRGQLGQLAEAKVHAEQAVMLFESLGRVSGQAVALRCLAEACQGMGDGLGALEALELAHTRCREAGDLRGLESALANLAGQYVRLGRMQEARGRVEEALALGIEHGHDMIVAYCTATLGTVLAVTGYLEQALERFTEARDRAAAMGDSVRAARGQMLMGIALMELGRFAESGAAFSGALARSVPLEQPVVDTEIRLHRARLDCRTARPPELSVVDGWIRLVEDSGQRWLLGEALEVRAMVAVAHGRPERAEPDARRSLQLAREAFSASGVARRLCLVGELAHGRGDALSVEVALAEVQPILHTMGCIPTAPLRQRIESLRAAVGSV